MDNTDTPSYIKSLLIPNAKKQGRKVWSVDLETVWLPFFTSTNVMGDTAIPLDALGCPIRLAYNKDGSVKFGSSGRPVTKVAKDLSMHVAMVRENFTANLMQYAGVVANEKPQDYSKMVRQANTAGLPISQHDKAELDNAIQLQIAAALREAEAKTEAQTEAKTEAPTEAKTKETVKV